jgi:uncharacterized protein YndB with AHSA1/START domain
MSTSTDRIEKQVWLKAPRARVWQALSNAEEFGNWFGVQLQGQAFVVDAHTSGKLTNPGCGHEDVVFDVLVVKLEPQQAMSLRWHPYAVDPARDYSGEPSTLIEFTLSEVDGGILLKVVESGFDGLPTERGLEALHMNTAGWEAQLVNIRKHLDARA